MPELLEMNAQMPSLNTKLAMETTSQLKQSSAPQAHVAIPSLILPGSARIWHCSPPAQP